MKLKFVLVLLAAGIAFASCDEKTTTGTKPTTTSQPYLGKLSVKVLDLANAPVSDMVVYVYHTREDLNNNFSLTSSVTSGNGKADLGELVEGFYYIRTGRLIQGNWYADTAAAQIIGGQQTDRVLYLHK